MATFHDVLNQAYAGSLRPSIPNRGDCSGFVITTARALGIPLPDLQADALLEHMRTQWEPLGRGAAGLSAARNAVAKRRFVVVGATAADLGDSHGHVAVVLNNAHQGMPFLYGGGSEKARTQGEKSLNWVFPRAKHDVLQYFAPRGTIVPLFDSDRALRDLPSAVRDQLHTGIAAPHYVQLAPPLRLCRFTDAGYGPHEGLVSPWWISESDFLKVIAARERSRAAHAGDKSRALSLGFLARWAVAVPQEWQSGDKRTPTTMDLLLRGDLKEPIDAFAGPGRVQRETSPNGIAIHWRGWPSITQYFIPAFSRKPPVNATVAEVLSRLAVGAPTYIKSTQLYERI